jgi:hypothetical protein
MSARRLAGLAEATLPAPIERCFAVLRDVEAWPQWQPHVTGVDVLERGLSGAPARVVIEAHVLAFRPRLVARVALDPPVTLRLDRIPFDDGDDEALRLTVTLQPGGATCTARAAVEAALDLPRLLPLPGAIADRVAGDLLDALRVRVQD